MFGRATITLGTGPHSSWSSGSGVGHIIEVALRRARLVLGWVTVHGYAVLVSNQPLGPTQPPSLCRMGNEYWPRGSDSALRPRR